VPGSIFEFLFKYRPLVFREGTWAFQAPIAAATLIGIVAVVAAVAAFTYTRVGGKATARDRVVLAALRVLALAVVAFALLRPTLLVSNVVPHQNYVGVLIDDSRSMNITDTGEPRHTAVTANFSKDSPLLKALEEKFQLRYFSFSSTAGRVNDAGVLTYSGEHTRIAPALDRAREELAPVPLSGLVVLSDGADNSATGLTESLLSLKAAQIPVYAVGLGLEKYDHDVELGRVTTPRQVLKGASVVVDLLVTQTGYSGQTVKVVVEDEGRIVGDTDVKFTSDGEPVPVRVRFMAEKGGPRRFTFRVPAQSNELVLENNEQTALIDVRDEKRKVLYFEGEPRWELAFMRRALEKDENVQLVVLLRSAENKYWRGSIDSAQELTHGFPRTREELFKYQGLVLGSVEASAFTHEQLRMIADFAGERGGGVMVLGGRHSLAEGGWAGTPVADVLPIEMETSGRVDTLYFDSLKVEPTRAGLAHPVTQIAPTEQASVAQWARMPRITTVNHVNTLKPGATALLDGKALRQGGDQPVLAFQRYGAGLAVALVAQDTWLWKMGYEVPVEDQTHITFWRQLLRWMVNNSPDQVAITLPADRAPPAEPLRVLAYVDDESFIRINNSSVIAHVTSPGGATQDVALEWTVENDGEYEGTFTPDELGLYRIEVDATRGSATTKSRPAFIDVATSRSEYFGSQLNAALLKRIASETGGRYYTPQDVSTLPEDLSITGRGSTVVEEKELWDMPILLLLLLTLMGAEWFYRRRKGLA
jgi:uncharacterized membrane protein